MAAGDMSLGSPARESFIASVGFSPENARALRQVHSRTVLVADERSSADLGATEADGLVCSGSPALLLTITVADCLPIFLVDRQTGAFGILHSGWKGTGIVLDAVELMRARFGSTPQDLWVTIGPGIGPCCYDVPHARALEFAGRFGKSAVVRRGERFFLDLRQANVTLLEAAGIADITVVSDCTCCSPFMGSFRRQGEKAFARMLAFIGRGAASHATGVTGARR